MPDTPIDLSEHIQSVRLKVPTAEVPIPPEGFGQLHSPAPGELALRLPDGSVVAIGGGGAATTLENERGLVTVAQVGEQDFAVTIYAKPGSSGKIQLSGELYGPTGARIPVPQAPTVPIPAEEVLTLHTDPKTVASGIEGRLLLPLGAWVVFTPGDTPYEDADGNLVVGWGTFGQGLAQIDARAVLGIFSGNTRTENFLAPTTSGVSDPLSFVGQALTVQLVAAATTGNGTLAVTPVYLVV